MGHTGWSSELESLQQLESYAGFQLYQLDLVLVQYSCGESFPFPIRVCETSNADMMASQGLYVYADRDSYSEEPSVHRRR